MFSLNREPRAQKKKKNIYIYIYWKFQDLWPSPYKIRDFRNFPKLELTLNKKFEFLFYIFIYSEVAIQLIIDVT